MHLTLDYIEKQVNTPKGLLIDALTLVIAGALDAGLTQLEIKQVVLDCLSEKALADVQDNRNSLLDDEWRLSKLLPYLRSRAEIRPE